MPVFSELRPEYQKSSFSCGVAVLDSYLKERARLDVKRGLCAVHILAEGTTIIGFYTLSAFTLQLQSLPPAIAKKYPANMLLPCWLIGRLAVDIKFQKQKFGQILLADALHNVVLLAEKAGGYCVVVDAKNERVKPFYEKYGFKPVIHDELRLYLPVSSIPV
ncbi:MAG: GNAT family N-acetyltransferase [Spirochaetaceae bacterium]|jgi:predicted GNAT family N-acyltransferase|nr:GNAT family N-acetyltransferase [Spirochaetaceae bacterium]